MSVNEPVDGNVFSLKDELIRRDYAYDEFSVGGEIYRSFRAPSGWVWISRKGFYDYPFISVPARMISKEKALGYEYVKRTGFTVADYISTNMLTEAEAFLNRNGTVVVKPGDASGSLGLTLNIKTKNQLAAALELADLGDGSVPIVQRQCSGGEFRITVIDSKVVSVIWRQTMRVVGDGSSTVRDLIERENRERELLTFPALSYPQISDEMITDNIDVTNIPAAGENIELNRATMIGKGASFIGVTHEIHSSYKDIALRLAQLVNPDFLIVDLMIENFQLPASADNYTFLEFNTSPALRAFTALRFGDKPDIIRLVADKIDTYAKTQTA